MVFEKIFLIGNRFGFVARDRNLTEEQKNVFFFILKIFQVRSTKTNVILLQLTSLYALRLEFSYFENFSFPGFTTSYEKNYCYVPKISAIERTAVCHKPDVFTREFSGTSLT